MTKWKSKSLQIEKAAHITDDGYSNATRAREVIDDTSKNIHQPCEVKVYASRFSTKKDLKIALDYVFGL